ncbi:MAG TPA: hypothetical protein VFZ25_02550 [Chloroflexota bacterium]|nr:hypothetical protein [Chloroflexota bacterium]
MNRAIMPLLIPLTAVVSVGVIVFLLSRLLIALNKETTPPVALGIAMIILLACAIVASRTEQD